MIPVTQTILKPPYGNCFAACVASIFEVGLADVPNYVSNDPPGQWFADWQSWLGRFNLQLVCFELAKGQRPWHPGWVIASVDSPRGPWQHVVVFEGDVLRHDPWPEPSGRVSDGGRDPILDFFMFYPIDPSKPSGIPASGAFAGDHEAAS